jgi:tetratricopeptide (TPR) repeat protein
LIGQQTTTIPAVEKIYVILDKYDSGRLDRLSQALWGLFPYLNLTSNLYLVCSNLPDGMPQVEGIQKAVKRFLRDNLFVRLYVHFVHSVPNQTRSEIDYNYQFYYQSWKRATQEFDREGYSHQEIPRIMLLPVLAPEKEVEPAGLITLLGLLKGAFMMPSLYLDEDTFSLARNKELRRNTEKLYFGTGDSRDAANVICNLCQQGIVEDLTVKLESDTGSVDDSCSPVLIISAQEGAVYGCVDQFLKRKSLGNIYDASDMGSLMGQYGETGRPKDDCVRCKEQAVESVVRSPLPKERIREIGALFYRFGVLQQEAGDHDRAVKSFKASLETSPAEEMGGINFRLGLCHTNLGNHDKAIDAFKKAEASFREKYFFHFYLGLCFFEKGSFSQALDAFSKAEALHPTQDDLVRILIYLGTCYNSVGDYKKAIVPLEKAKAIASQVKEISSTLGFSFYQLKNYDKAIDNLKRAVELDPLSAIDFASLGANYREKGDLAKAVAMFEKALQLDPSMEIARQNLGRLKTHHD